MATVYGLTVNPNRKFYLYNDIGIKSSIPGPNSPIKDIGSSIGASLYLNEMNSIGFSYSHEYSAPLEDALSKTNNTGNKLLELINQGKAISSAVISEEKASSNSPSKVMSIYHKIPAYEESSTIKMPSTLSFTFAYGQEGLFNGLEEVVKPIIDFVSRFAPLTSGGMVTDGPLPLSGEVLASIAKKMINNTLFNEDKAEDEEAAPVDKSLGIIQAAFTAASGFINVFNRVIEEGDRGPYKNKKAFCQAKIGRLIFPNFVVKGIGWEFDFSQVDDKGYPYRGTVSLNDCETIKIATSNDIAKMIRTG